ncbi:MAG TPA: cyanophycin synthetase, partial [Marmoricola sp.]|nr:cyanophycin synthetase [Marmoricola sp.]
CAEVGATLRVEGIDFGVESRVAAVGGQMLEIAGPWGHYTDLFLPLYGAHQAQNVSLALAVVEVFLGGQALGEQVVSEGFAEMTSPGRLEIVRRSPTIVLDAAHNPHGARAVVDALSDSFSFSPLIGVIGVMGDKDVEGLLAEFEPVFAHVVCTQNSTARALPANELAEIARGIFGGDRVAVAANLVDAIDQATTLAEAGGVFGEGLGSGGVLVTGSVITVGEARALINPKEL